MPDIAHSIGELAWSGNKGGSEDSERVHTPSRTILMTLLTTNANGSQIQRRLHIRQTRSAYSRVEST